LRREVATKAECPGSNAVLALKIHQMLVVVTNDTLSFAVVERNVVEGTPSWSLPRHEVLSTENDAEAIASWLERRDISFALAFTRRRNISLTFPRRRNISLAFPRRRNGSLAFSWRGNVPLAFSWKRMEMLVSQSICRTYFLNAIHSPLPGGGQYPFPPFPDVGGETGFDVDFEDWGGGIDLDDTGGRTGLGADFDETGGDTGFGACFDAGTDFEECVGEGADFEDT
jgi:hypothetical protein